MSFRLRVHRLCELDLHDVLAARLDAVKTQRLKVNSGFGITVLQSLD